MTPVRETLDAFTTIDSDTGALPVALTDSSGVLLATFMTENQTGVTTAVNGNGAAIDVTDYREVEVFATLTAISGTSPTIFWTIDTSPDGTNWSTLVSTAVLSATGNTMKSASAYNGTGFFKYVRIRWVVTGTGPSFTFNAWLGAKP